MCGRDLRKLLPWLQAMRSEPQVRRGRVEKFSSGRWRGHSHPEAPGQNEALWEDRACKGTGGAKSQGFPHHLSKDFPV